MGATSVLSATAFAASAPAPGTMVRLKSRSFTICRQQTKLSVMTFWEVCLGFPVGPSCIGFKSQPSQLTAEAMAIYDQALSGIATCDDAQVSRRVSRVCGGVCPEEK